MKRVIRVTLNYNYNLVKYYPYIIHHDIVNSVMFHLVE